MKVAVEGCAHGELEKIYETIQGIEKAQNIKIDLLLCCGDFQSTRSLEDLQTMAVPQKYLDMCTFYKYYSGERVAPILTIFVGGNHEASNYLQELPYGGWVAPNIYYLGYAGVVRVNGIRIAGVSGIYKGHDFLRGRHEFTPYTEATRKSVYHVRQLEVFRLKQLSGLVDIFMSHDWPRGIYNYGNKSQLARFKPHFRDEIDSGQLGSRPCEDLLKTLKPSYWFAAHLHCKFVAVVVHDDVDNDNKNNRSMQINSESEAGLQKFESVTKFLALDKCLPKRRFLQIVDIESIEHTDDGDLCFEYDVEWLAILHLTNHLISVKNSNYYMPGRGGGMTEERHNFTPSVEELDQIRKKFDGDFRISADSFCRTVRPYDPNDVSNVHISQPKAQLNPQTENMCDILGIDDPVRLAMIINGQELNHSSTFEETSRLSLDQSNVSDLSLFGDVFTSPQPHISPLKRKSILGMSLPKPLSMDEVVNSSPLKLLLKEDVSVNPDELQLNNSSSEEIHKCDMECEENISLASQENKLLSERPNLIAPEKKLKRRNQSIYQYNNDQEVTG